MKTFYSSTTYIIDYTASNVRRIKNRAALFSCSYLMLVYNCEVFYQLYPNKTLDFFRKEICSVIWDVLILLLMYE